MHHCCVCMCVYEHNTNWNGMQFPKQVTISACAFVPESLILHEENRVWRAMTNFLDHSHISLFTAAELQCCFVCKGISVKYNHYISSLSVSYFHPLSIWQEKDEQEDPASKVPNRVHHATDEEKLASTVMSQKDGPEEFSDCTKTTKTADGEGEVVRLLLLSLLYCSSVYSQIINQ